jgi:hypothetical protein
MTISGTEQGSGQRDPAALAAGAGMITETGPLASAGFDAVARAEGPVADWKAYADDDR